jgi:uncharacterized protein YodC (DUF2158 family)
MKKEIKYWAAKDGYLVHRDGTIYKMNWSNTGKMKKVKQHIDKGGYLCFWFNGKECKAHRFIAELFVPNSNNLPEVNHINEIKDDNRVENLEWCDRKHNCNHGTRNERMRVSLTNYPKFSKPVYQYTLDRQFVAEYPSIHEVERKLGYNNGYISACCLGKRKTAYSYVWTYTPPANI